MIVPHVDLAKKSRSNGKSRELAEAIDQSLEELGQQLEAGNSEQLNRFLEFLSRFHRYSIGNLMLIYSTLPDATHVAGFKRWRELGRQVRKGEKGIPILAPMVRRKKADDEPTDSMKVDSSEGGTQRRQVFGFRAAHVFDVTQTDGDELPKFSEPTGDPGQYIHRLREQIRSLGIELIEEPIPGGALGMSEGGRITIQPGMTPAHTVATMIHELGHERLHRTERRESTSKLVRETEAEAVAFAVCQRIGIESNSSSSDYIRLYGGSSETLQQSLEHIRKCTAEILEDLLEDGDGSSTTTAVPKQQLRLF
ncbi:MAG: ArdC-like ssDNA-binding domain-containing protein [Fuerstiella sp.]